MQIIQKKLPVSNVQIGNLTDRNHLPGKKDKGKSNLKETSPVRRHKKK